MTKKWNVRSLALLARMIGQKSGVEVVFDPRAQTASTDSKKVTLPVVRNIGSEDEAMLIVGLVDHESAHCRHTNFEMIPANQVEMIIWNTIEDVWIEREQAKAYPGCFRNIVGSMEVMTKLQSQLVEAMVAQDTLRETARANDTRVLQGQRKVDAIYAQIEAERAKFGVADMGPNGESYAQLVAEYEELATDMEFAETTYRAAQASYEAALAEGQRQSRYLAAHIAPRMAESSLLPNRPVLLFKIFGVLLLGWSILLLCYYSMRDRR